MAFLPKPEEPDRRITDGLGNLMTDYAWISENLFHYKSFDDAAPLIQHHWTRHHIHKEIARGRVRLSNVLIIYDKSRFSIGVSERIGKKMYLHEDEIARLKNEVPKRKKREHERCHWCQRILRYCFQNACEGRRRNSIEFRETVEIAADRIAEYVRKNEKGKRVFSEYNREGERKKFRYRGRPRRGS